MSDFYIGILSIFNLELFDTLMWFIRLGWPGHIAKMGDNRLPEQVLSGICPHTKAKPQVALI